MVAQASLATGLGRAPCHWPGAILLLVALMASPMAARAQVSDPAISIKRLLLDASRSLQSANAALFMGLFDRASFDGYAALREDVGALTAHRRIASSVSIGVPEGGPEQWTANVDWLLELTPKLDPGPVERRRQTLRVSVRKRGKRWRIVGLAPAGFFAPTQPGR